MSPVAPSSGHASRALLLAFAAIALGMLALWGASSVLTSRHNDRAHTRTVGGVVDLGRAEKLAEAIHGSAGVPVYYPDVSGNNARSVYLNHHGDDPETGWTAFLAQVPGADDDCLWEWNAEADHFEATCDRERTADRRGSGLTQYPVRVEEGRLKVDLTVTGSHDSTTAAPTTLP